MLTRPHIHRAVQRLARRFLKRPEGRPLAPPTLLSTPSLEVQPPPIRLPSTYQAAAQSLVDMAVVRGAPYRAREYKVSWEGSDPDLVGFSRALLLELKRRGMPFVAHEYVRDADRQNALYRQGFTRAKFGNSAHNYGCAVDIIHFSKAWDLTKRQWDVIGAIGKEVARRRNLKIVWGGDFRTIYDPAHWELEDWRLRRKS